MSVADPPATAAPPLVANAFASPGSMTVDWEERVNPERLREYRFGRARDFPNHAPAPVYW